MNCNDEDVAKCFGLEIARLLLDVSFREFSMARQNSEKADDQAESAAINTKDVE